MKNERSENPKTLLLYEVDGMITRFKARVTGAGVDEKSGRNFVILDCTVFFPGGGGQQPDTGEFTLDDGKVVEVYDVDNDGGIVRHFVKEPIPVGTTVAGQIDELQRFARMQDHGAEHLLCGIIHNRFGYENVGFHMTDDEVVFDVDGPLSEDDIRSVERRANEIVFENVPISISFPTPEEARNTEYRSKLDTFENIRLVTIAGYDVCACCAPQVESTGQLGVIKILSFMPHRGGTRMTMTAGLDAYSDYVYLHDSNAKIMELLSAKRDHTADFAADAMERMQALKEENARLRKEMAAIVTKQVMSDIEAREADDAHPEIIFTGSLDPVGLRNLVNECTKKFKGKVCAFLGDDENGYRYIFAVSPEVAKEADLKDFAAEFNEKLNAKGGGSDVMVQGSVTAKRRQIECYLAPNP